MIGLKTSYEIAYNGTENECRFELYADSASDLQGLTHYDGIKIQMGSECTDIATGDKYLLNGSGVWVLQPSANPLENVYTKTDINNMITAIYGYIRYYHIEQISTNGTITFYTFAGVVENLTIYGNLQQNGTPTPDNPITPEICGEIVGTDCIIPITNAGQTININLGQTTTVRRIKKKILRGSDEYTYQAQYSRFNFYIDDAFSAGTRNTQCVCTHYASVHNGEPIADVPDKSIYINTAQTGSQFSIKDESITTVEDFKSYLESQYANGTPVTIWYILSAQETSSVNEPIAKIGEYIDELQCDNVIPTINGENTLTVDTTLKPSKIEISGER